MDLVAFPGYVGVARVVAWCSNGASRTFPHLGLVEWVSTALTSGVPVVVSTIVSATCFALAVVYRRVGGVIAD